MLVFSSNMWYWTTNICTLSWGRSTFLPPPPADILCVWNCAQLRPHWIFCPFWHIHLYLHLIQMLLKTSLSAGIWQTSKSYLLLFMLMILVSVVGWNSRKNWSQLWNINFSVILVCIHLLLRPWSMGKCKRKKKG